MSTRTRIQAKEQNQEIADTITCLKSIFLLADGWTVNDHSADGTGYRLHVQKAVDPSGTIMYFNFRSAISEYGSTITGDNYNHIDLGRTTGIMMNGSTGYDVGESWHEQPGFPVSQDYGSGLSFGMCMSPMSTTAIPAYYFFTSDDSVHIVVETETGKYQFMSFGQLEKQGTYTDWVI